MIFPCFFFFLFYCGLYVFGILFFDVFCFFYFSILQKRIESDTISLTSQNFDYYLNNYQHQQQQQQQKRQSNYNEWLKQPLQFWLIEIYSGETVVLVDCTLASPSRCFAPLSSFSPLAVSSLYSIAAATLFPMRNFFSHSCVVHFFSNCLLDQSRASHEIAPIWEETHKSVKGMINMGRINVDYERRLALQIGLSQLPAFIAVSYRYGCVFVFCFSFLLPIFTSPHSHFSCLLRLSCLIFFSSLSVLQCSQVS